MDRDKGRERDRDMDMDRDRDTHSGYRDKDSGYVNDEITSHGLTEAAVTNI